MPLSANLRASLFMSASMAGFTVNDALVKALMEDINAGQIMFLRGVIIVACLAVYMRLARRPLIAPGTLSPPVFLRTGAELCATVLFLMALANLPLANASAVMQALPLAVTIGAALFLREQVGWRRWSAILVGFAGVLLIIRPGLEGFNAYSLLALGTVGAAAVRDLATRKVSAAIPTLSVATLTAIAVSLTGLVLIGPMGGWQPLTPAMVLVLTAAAGFLFIGYQCVILAMREGEIGLVAPFRYTSLLWAILLGFVIFGELPDLLTVIGASIVVATGIYTLYRERVRRSASQAANRSAAAPPPARGT